MLNVAERMHSKMHDVIINNREQFGENHLIEKIYNYCHYCEVIKKW